MKLRFLLLIVAVMIFATVANAQSASDILVSVVPENPAPHENTTVVLKSYVNNLDAAMITWSLDGKTVASAIGKKSFSFTAPAAGIEASVVVTVTLPDGPVETKINIKPSVMVLLWQANDSYVPPFYKGKALPTPDSEVKVVAMPEIRALGSGLVDSKNMTYYWKKDYTNNVDGSGYGKNYFTFINDYLEDSNNVSVTASTLDQSSSASGSVDMGMVEPKILFYKSDSNLGTNWDQALRDPHGIQGNEVVEAVPYFISPKELQHPYLVWNWFINDARVSLTSFRKNLMPLQAEAGTHGTSKLRLEIANQSKLFQATSKEITIEF